MSFREVWEFRQELPVVLDLVDIRRKLREIVPSRSFLVIETEADPDLMCGCYISPRNEDTLFHGCPPGAGAIIISRSLDERWKRFVQLKELMHLFDDPLKSTTTAAEFEMLLSGLCASIQSTQRTVQHQSEIECLWMAGSLMCTEEVRLDFTRQREAKQLSDAQIAEAIEMPEAIIGLLFSQYYKEQVDMLIATIIPRR